MQMSVRIARHIVLRGFLILISGFSLVTFSWADHGVGEHDLEETPVWNNCCRERDCVPQRVEVKGKEGHSMISVEIEGVRTSVAKEKLSPVPSAHTWVCYYNLNGKITNDNIRCILYPQQTGTTRAPQRESTLSIG
jgi:hypothetical protein